MNWQERIAIHPDVLVGKPVIKGTRISVEFILDLIGQRWSPAEIVRNYPHISEDDILACVLYAKNVLESERIYPLPSGERKKVA